MIYQPAIIASGSSFSNRATDARLHKHLLVRRGTQRIFCVKCGAALSGDPKILELCPKWRDDASLYL